MLMRQALFMYLQVKLKGVRLIGLRILCVNLDVSYRYCETLQREHSMTRYELRSIIISQKLVVDITWCLH